MIGNADAHLKNLSLLERPEGLRLSPAYDLVNTPVYPEYERYAALAIGGKKRHFGTLGPALIEKLGTDIGLPRRAVQQSLTRLAKGFAGADALIFPPQVGPDDFRIQYRNIVQDNAGRIFA